MVKFNKNRNKIYRLYVVDIVVVVMVERTIKITKLIFTGRLFRENLKRVLLDELREIKLIVCGLT
jgi:hypothetical protein